MTARTLLALLLASSAVTALPACDAEPAPTYDTSDDLVQDSAGGDGEEAGGSEDGPAPTLLVECDQPLPCDAMEVASIGDADGAPEVFQDSDAERCVLETLAAGQPAIVQTVADLERSTSFLDFSIGPEGVLRQAYGTGAGVGDWINAPRSCRLRTLDYFRECLEVPDSSCLEPADWVVDCVELSTFACGDTSS